MSRNVFMVAPEPLPPIVLSAELATRRWRAECHCGHPSIARTEAAAMVASVEHLAYAHANSQLRGDV